ncbi:hypothetical protein KIW84_070758 [Lathyrus oleraceus]|uniref:MULE transposase domain-containing protein n=1 Tax=Pisum sativum TaxID=3888 RepID=A0A9D4ZSP2_PEA|nr:hypothetical protein KIW84_070758 [Pisum sativum]
MNSILHRIWYCVKDRVSESNFFLEQSMQVFPAKDDVDPEAEAKVNVVDEEEEETETQVDHMLNNNIEDDDQPTPLPPMKRTVSRSYVIECRNILCNFRLVASHKKKSDSWEIASIDPPHSCIATNVEQDHGKLSAALICQDILPLINKEPSVKVSIIKSHIRTRYNYTPSYKKAWIARTKVVEQELLQFMETLPAIMPDGTCVAGNRIFHRLFWAFDPCIKGFAFCKPIIQIDGTWLYEKYKGTLLIAVAQDGNNNVFPIVFALVEGETVGGWGFFLRHLRTYVAPQANLCLIFYRHAAIESAYNNHGNE